MYRLYVTTGTEQRTGKIWGPVLFLKYSEQLRCAEFAEAVSSKGSG